MEMIKFLLEAAERSSEPGTKIALQAAIEEIQSLRSQRDFLQSRWDALPEKETALAVLGRTLAEQLDEDKWNLVEPYLRAAEFLFTDHRTQLTASEKARQEAEEVARGALKSAKFSYIEKEQAESLLAERDAQIAVYREALESLEWIEVELGGGDFVESRWYCPDCGMEKPAGHDEECVIGQALSTAPSKVQAVVEAAKDYIELLTPPVSMGIGHEVAAKFDRLTEAVRALKGDKV